MTKPILMIGLWLLILLPVTGRASGSDAEKELLARIDAPLLYLKRHSYKGIHIYDTFYKWPPGGGGIFIVENTHEARSEWKERCIIGEDTSHLPGRGVYTHPEISWDAKKLLFCYKETPGGNTCIYEIGIDGRGLRKVSDPAETGAHFNGTKNRSGMHDISPSYLPDGRIVFLSTRAAGLVPCNNSGVTLLHVMNADGSDICLHAPMLVKARKKPPVLPQLTDRSMKKGTFFVQNVYEGLAGVKHGEAKWLRVVEESSRVSESPLSRNPYNQTFLVSGALAFATKIYHGMVPINDDGSIYFEAPSGRLLYFQVLEKERDLVMAWIDSNGIYYGNWDYTEHGYTSQAVDETYTRLGKVMEEAKCTQCHDGKITRDWVNLQRPELSRILRAPLSKAGAGLGGEICRDHPMDPRRKRITLLRSGRYEHAVKALSFFPSEPVPALQAGGRTEPSFASPADPLYQKMLAIIETGRTKTLSEPRADMPGALVIAGEDRIMIEPDLPARAPELSAEYGTASQLHLTWPRTPDNIGLPAEVHRSYQADFRPGPETLVAETLTDHFIDQEPRAATPHYALVLKNRDGARSAPSHVDARNVHPELLVAGLDAGAIRIRNGKVTQVYETPGICMDAWQLRDGSVVATGRSGLRKYDPHGKLVFEYRAANEKSEIYAGMPLPDGGTLVSESAPARLIELDRDGTPRKVVPVTDIALDHPHKQMRGARKNAKGEYVIVSSYEKRLIVLNADGSRKKIIDLGTLPAPLTPKLLHSVVPLDNDHLLVGTSYDGSFVMLDENERVIWSLSPQDLPELGIKYASGMHRLPNGNLICTTYNSAYPIFEITPDKEIVWKIKADKAFGKPLNVQAVYLSGNAENFELRK